MDAQIIFHPPHSKDEGRVGFLGVFASPTVENAFRQQHFRNNLWLSRFLVIAGMFRVSMLLLADYHHFGVNRAFWTMCASRLLFLFVSAWELFALRRVASPAVADRRFFAWACSLIAMTVFALSARPPSNSVLLLMSFGVIVVAYCVTPLPLTLQATIALTYSASVLYVSHRVESATFLTVATTHLMSHFFGAVMSWWLNHQRREIFFCALQDAELRASLEKALAEVRTLRGLLCMCAWCKRIRDEEQTWESVEKYVQSRTHASFSHGICPDCFQSQLGEIAR